MAIITEPSNNEKKKKKMKTTVADPAAGTPSSTAVVFLPDELILEVLLRLPAKSLARFRCVCRSWNHLLRSDSDAAFQRLYSDRQRAAASVGRLAFAAALLAPAHPWEVCEGLTIMPCDGCPRFVGAKPCHRGVVLLSRPCTGAYTLCNLSTGGLLRLPPCPTVGYLSAAGVGYHAAADEYKVVQLALVTDRPVWESLDCHVLTVGAANGVRGGWRSIVGGGGGGLLGDRRNILIEPMDPVFANGCLHWTLVTGMLLRDEDDDDDDGKPPEGILSFSLATESFATVPVPPFVAADLVPYDDDHPHAARLRTATTSDNRLVMQPIGTALAELDGCLCMIRDLRRAGAGATMFEVWKLKDYESGVWSLDYRIHEDLLATSSSSSSSLTTKKLMEPWLVIPICYLPSNDGDGDDDDGHDDKSKKKILLVTTAHDVHLYDPQTATLETVASAAHCCNYPDPTTQDNELYVVMRQESLLHIDGMEYYGAVQKGITELIN